MAAMAIALSVVRDVASMLGGVVVRSVILPQNSVFWPVFARFWRAIPQLLAFEKGGKRSVNAMSNAAGARERLAPFLRHEEPAADGQASPTRPELTKGHCIIPKPRECESSPLKIWLYGYGFRKFDCPIARIFDGRSRSRLAGPQRCDWTRHRREPRQGVVAC